jgi:hypothetical protein
MPLERSNRCFRRGQRCGRIDPTQGSNASSADALCSLDDLQSIGVAGVEYQRADAPIRFDTDVVACTGNDFRDLDSSIAATGEFERKPGDIIAFDRNRRAISAGSLADDDGGARRHGMYRSEQIVGQIDQMRSQIGKHAAPRSAEAPGDRAITAQIAAAVVAQVETAHIADQSVIDASPCFLKGWDKAQVKVHAARQSSCVRQVNDAFRFFRCCAKRFFTEECFPGSKRRFRDARMIAGGRAAIDNGDRRKRQQFIEVRGCQHIAQFALCPLRRCSAGSNDPHQRTRIPRSG